MATGPTPQPQVRLVRCPQCRQLLPEVANVPVYRCGGCGALLQAKNRKKDAKSTESGIHETQVSLKNELKHVSDNQEPSSLDHEPKPSTKSVADHNDAEQDENGYGDCSGEEPGAMDLSDENRSSEGSHFESLPSAGPNSEAGQTDESPPFAGAKSEEEDKNECVASFRISSTDHLVAKGGINSAVAVQRPLGESIPSGTVSAPHKTVLQGFDSMRSRGTSATTESASPSSEEHSGKLRDMSKSPTTRGSHAYDGSISSYDGLEDQFSDRYIHSLETTRKAQEFSVSGEKLRRDQFLVDAMTNIDSEMQHQASKMLPVSSGKKKLYAMKGREWERDELQESTRHHHPPRNWTRAERNEFPPRVPLHGRGFQAGCESGGQVRDEYQCDSSFHSSGKLEYREQEKMKLLRMIYELQDQLDKSCDLERKEKGRVSTGVTWKEKNIPTCYSHELRYPMYPGRGRVGSNSAQQFKFSQMSFSGEAANNRHHFDRRCLHCHPKDWQSSAPLPPVHQHKKGLCGVYAGHNGYNPCCSCPSSSQHSMESEFCIQGRETMCDDQRHKDHVMKKYLREKHLVVKRHFRPKAGGAPFVTCYHCSKLLQLPADFLLFKRGCYRLRCGSCSGILKFSVQNRTHIVPYSPDAMDPPPSEAEDNSGVINRRSTASSSQSNNCLCVDPVSCSDDYGLPFCKSCSTEEDPISLTALQDNADDRKMSYASSFGSMGKKGLIRKQSQNKYKNPMETYGSPGSSSNISKAEKYSSEIEVVQPRNSSPLHRLMGYASPSIVIRGSGPSAAGTS